MSSLDWKNCHKSRADAESLWDSETFLRHRRAWDCTGLPEKPHRSSDGAVLLRLNSRTFLCKTPDGVSVLEDDISSVTCVTPGVLPKLQKGLLVALSATSESKFGAVWTFNTADGSDSVSAFPAPSETHLVLKPAGSDSWTFCVLCEVLPSKQAWNEVLVVSRQSERQSCLVLHKDVLKTLCKAALEMDSHSNDPRFDWDFWKMSGCPADSPLGLSLERLRIDRSVLWEPQSGVSSVTASSSTPFTPSFLTAGPGTMSGEVTLHFTLQKETAWIHCNSNHIYCIHAEIFQNCNEA